MIVRVWTTTLAPGAKDRYLAFAHEHSLPMLRDQAGCEGVHFVALSGGRQAVLTFWKDDCSVLMLEHSESYRASVAEVQAAGVLVGAPSVRTIALDGDIAETLMALSQAQEFQ